MNRPPLPKSGTLGRSRCSDFSSRPQLSAGSWPLSRAMPDPIPRSWRFARRFRARYRTRRRGMWGKAHFEQLIPDLNALLVFAHCSVSITRTRYDIFIRMEPLAREGSPPRSLLLFQGTVETNVSQRELWTAFSQLCPGVDWVVDFSVV